MKALIILLIALVLYSIPVVSHLFHTSFYDSVEGVVTWHSSVLANTSYAQFYQKSLEVKAPPLYGFIGYFLVDAFHIFTEAITRGRLLACLSQILIVLYLIGLCKQHKINQFYVLLWLFFLPVIHLGWTFRFDNTALLFTIISFHLYSQSSEMPTKWMHNLSLFLSTLFMTLALNTKFTIGISLFVTILIVLIKKRNFANLKFYLFSLLTLITLSLFLFQNITQGLYIKSLLINNNPFSFYHFVDRSILILIGTPIILIVFYLKNASFFDKTWWFVSGLIAFITLFKTGSNINYFLEFGFISMLLFLKNKPKIIFSTPFKHFTACYLLLNLFIVLSIVKANYNNLNINKQQILKIKQRPTLNSECLDSKNIKQSSLIVFSQKKPCLPDPHIAQFLTK
ncbi:hypothetical protein OAA91_01195 [Fibrobacterales bacterium]|nr:hypothetical protein [Fibrobacterales bacterium]